MGPIYKFVMAMLAKGAGKKTGIATISKATGPEVQDAFTRVHTILRNMGVDVTKLKSPDEVKKFLNMYNSWVKQQKPRVIGQDHPEFKGITEALFGKKKATVTKLPEGGKDKVPVTQQFTGKSFTADDHIKFIKSKEPIEAMKEANSVIGRKGRYKNLSHEEADRILKDTEDHIFQRDIPEEDFASGGITGQLHLNRPGFDKGKKVDLGKRKFLKGAGAGLGVLSMLPFVGKFFKPAAKLAKTKSLTSVPIGSAEGMPDWFVPLVNKVIKEGDDVTKKLATQERHIVHNKKLGDPKDVYADDITVTQELDTGNVRVEYHSGSNMGEAPIQLDYKAPQIAEEASRKAGKEIKTKPEFSAVESEPRVANWDGDIEWDGENVVGKVDDLFTDTTQLESYATGKKPTIKKLVEGKKKQKYVNKLHDDVMEQSDYIENRTGHMAPEELLEEADAAYHKSKEGLASGGIAGQLHLNQGGEAMPDPDYGPHTQTIDDDWYLNKYEKFLDGYLKSQEGSSTPLSQQDVNIMSSFFNNYVEYGGDPTKFEERIQNLLKPPEKPSSGLSHILGV